jgi:hypothetical protein
MKEIPCKNCITLGVCKARFKDHDSLLILTTTCSILKEYVSSDKTFQAERYFAARAYLSRIGGLENFYEE